MVAALGPRDDVDLFVHLVIGLHGAADGLLRGNRLRGGLAWRRFPEYYQFYWGLTYTTASREGVSGPAGAGLSGRKTGEAVEGGIHDREPILISLDRNL